MENRYYKNTRLKDIGSGGHERSAQPCHFSLQQRQLLLNRIPDNARIDTKIFVHDEVAKILDQTPLNSRDLSLEVFGDMDDGLADDNELAQGCGIGFTIAEKELVSVPYVKASMAEIDSWMSLR